MKVGYAHVSTREQNLEAQTDALTRVGCDKIYSEKISSTRADRAQLSAALENMREGDTLVVTKLDCLARSLKEKLQSHVVVKAVPQRKSMKAIALKQ